jgi:hypothetical protein
MSIDAKRFFEIIAQEDGVTFRDLSPLVGFHAVDMHGNVIGTATYEDGVYVFSIR